MIAMNIKLGRCTYLTNINWVVLLIFYILTKVDFQSLGSNWTNHCQYRFISPTIATTIVKWFIYNPCISLENIFFKEISYESYRIRSILLLLFFFEVMKIVVYYFIICKMINFNFQLISSWHSHLKDFGS